MSSHKFKRKTTDEPYDIANHKYVTFDHFFKFIQQIISFFFSFFLVWTHETEVTIAREDHTHVSTGTNAII